MSARVVKNIRDIVDRYRAMMGTLNGNAASVLATEGAALEAEFIREILKRSGKLTPAQVNEVRAIFRDLVARSSEDIARRMTKYVGPAMKLTAHRTIETTSDLLAAVNHPQFRETLLAARAYAEKIQGKFLFDRSEFYRKRWAKAWDKRWTKVVERAGRDIEDVLSSGGGWADVAAKLVPLGSLPEFPGSLTPKGAPAGLTIRGKMHPEAFARAFARTSLGELSAAESIAEGHEIGLRWFVNIGVPDDRQSEICADACAQQPKTIEEWRVWRRNPADPSNDGGLPKRHVSNCRDEMVGVPNAALAFDWRQNNPNANTYQRQYAGAFERKAA